LKGTVEVTDLFKGAFLLCMGARLDRVQVRNNGRRIATFLITGKDLDRHDCDYRAGRALVNPVQLRESLNHLRDVMFDQLRKHEGRCTVVGCGRSLRPWGKSLRSARLIRPPYQPWSRRHRACKVRQPLRRRHFPLFARHNHIMSTCPKASAPWSSLRPAVRAGAPVRPQGLPGGMLSILIRP